MTDNLRKNRCGARPLKTHQGGRVPGPMPQRGPTQATGGPRAPFRGGARRRVTRVKATGHNNRREAEPRPLEILQWNAEGISKKKLPFTERLHKENIDIACVQETHLTENLRFTVRGYQTYRVDRERRHKGGILILVKNHIPAKHITVDTEDQAEITGVEITLQEKQIRIYNVYCPADRQLSLHAVDVLQDNCLVVGDFNSHSTSWGYSETDARGEEVEDWQIDQQLHLLNQADDPPTFYSRRWLSSTTPDLAFATNNLQASAKRMVLDQLAGSDHRPVKLSFNLNHHPEDCRPLPRWNYRKAKWEGFSILTDEYTTNINTHQKDTNNMTKAFNAAILKAAIETIPRGARKNYRPYWTKELQQLEDQANEAREKAEKEPSTENNISLKEKTASYKKVFIQAARTNWKRKTENLNLEKDGARLWKLTKAMNDEKTSTPPIVLEDNEVILTGKQAADHLISSYERISSNKAPKDREKEVLEQQKHYKDMDTEEEVMKELFTEKELELGIKQMQKEKSPGPDGITNEMLQHLGPTAKKTLLNLFNASWKNASVPQSWRDAIMIPIHKKGKDKTKADSYRPISLTSCVGKLMERLVNNRLTWYLEKKEIISDKQAGFRQHRSTEDQVAYIAQKIEDALQDKKHTITVWIDLEKAFDKVWKNGLKLKMHQYGISGHMYKWISQYLTNRKARVQNRRHQSRQKTMKEGVPQGGVLSPTLFIIFMNDILDDIPAWIHGAIYADDLAIWCSEQYITTATVRIQEALRKIETWTKKWLVTINAKKTTYTIFSLATKELSACLQVNGHVLPQDKSPTYLGVTFDPRMTWRHQISKCTERARLRLALMKKLSGTSWGADHNIQKKLYLGRVRPVLEYGTTAWGTAAKTNLDKVARIQNQASRIITGALKSTPIQAMETLTGLQSLESRRDAIVLTQAAKFKRMKNHPMNKRMSEPTKCRLKRSSFVHNARRLERQDPELLQQGNKQIPTHSSVPAWRRDQFPEVRETIPGISTKGTQSEPVRKALTLDHMEQAYPKEMWTYAYTDGSAEEATRNGGGGIFLTLKDGTHIRRAIPTGKFSTNYKAEADALMIAAETLYANREAIHPRVVIFSDALSVLQAVQNPKNKDLNPLASALARLQQATELTIIQWIPSHCNIAGNEEADRLAKEGGQQPQEEQQISYEEAKTIIKEKSKKRWLQIHPDYNRTDAYYLLPRSDQVNIVRLRTGHSRLRHHMFTRFRIGESSMCPCNTAPMTVEHFLQDCPTHHNLRAETWPADQPMREKLYGSLESLHRTAAFVSASGVPV